MASEATPVLAVSLRGGPARDLPSFPRDLRRGPALNRTTVVAPRDGVPADSPDPSGRVVATAVPSDLVASAERLTLADPDTTTGIPALSSSNLARAWEAAGDWLADLAKAEAAEAIELAANLAPVVLASGVFLSWGSIYHSSRSAARRRDDERLCFETR
jgi:hypothetical protein